MTDRRALPPPGPAAHVVLRGGPRDGLAVADPGTEALPMPHLGTIERYVRTTETDSAGRPVFVYDRRTPAS